MSKENGKHSPESDAAGLNFEETKLTLGLPGESRGPTEIGAKSGTKRGFSEAIDLNVESSSEKHSESDDDGVVVDEASASKTPPPKAQVVGWPPVRASRKNVMKSCKLIKVGLDGAPYLRKVDLEMYNSYHQLLTALQNMFSSCLTIRNYLNERKLMDPVHGVEYLPTYEDKDGDWMLVGDVPWKMFVESCKRLRLMKSSEAIGLRSKIEFQGDLQNLKAQAIERISLHNQLNSDDHVQRRLFFWFLYDSFFFGLKSFES